MNKMFDRENHAAGNYFYASDFIEIDRRFHPILHTRSEVNYEI